MYSWFHPLSMQQCMFWSREYCFWSSLWLHPKCCVVVVWMRFSFKICLLSIFTSLNMLLYSVEYARLHFCRSPRNFFFQFLAFRSVSINFPHVVHHAQGLPEHTAALQRIYDHLHLIPEENDTISSMVGAYCSIWLLMHQLRENLGTAQLRQSCSLLANSMPV